MSCNVKNATAAHALISLLLIVTAAPVALSKQSHGTGYSALCVVGKDENPYLAEWLNYHKCMGISHIYMYDHNSSVPFSQEAQVQEHISAGYVTYIPWQVKHTKFAKGYTFDLNRFLKTVQGRAYQHCLKTYRQHHRFIGFIDFDEFIVMLDKGVRNVNQLLMQYEQHGGLSLFYRALGPSGHQAAPTGSVIDNYQSCLPARSEPNKHFKTFVNTEYKPVMFTPHRASFPGHRGMLTVDENHKPIGQGRLLVSGASHSKAVIYHYVTKSSEEFEIKLERGGGDGVRRKRNFLRIMEQYGTDTCPDAIAVRERICSSQYGGR